MTRPDYDTREGIARYIKTFEGLRELRRLRHEAGYDRDEDLDEFCVLGRFYLDRSGNFGVLVENAPADIWKLSRYEPDNVWPAVLTGEELGLICRGDFWSAEHRSPFPPEGAVCPTCGKGWSLVDCWEFVTRLRDDAVEHPDCFQARTAKEQRAEFKKCFENAGFPDVNLITIPNEYHGNERRTGKPPYYASPWYLAQVGEGGVFKIGWRKSVISIDWSATGKYIGRHAYAPPEDDWVTSEAGLTHAHGYAKASQYLAKLVPLI